jgi:hypothetical protein
MWADMIVRSEPLVDDDLILLCCGEPFSIEHLAGAALNSWSNTVVGAYAAQSHTGFYNMLVGAEVASDAAGVMDFNTIVGANAVFDFFTK